jgi:hypothetical protein
MACAHRIKPHSRRRRRLVSYLPNFLPDVCYINKRSVIRIGNKETAAEAGIEEEKRERCRILKTPFENKNEDLCVVNKGGWKRRKYSFGGEGKAYVRLYAKGSRFEYHGRVPFAFRADELRNRPDLYT